MALSILKQIYFNHQWDPNWYYHFGSGYGNEGVLNTTKKWRHCQIQFSDSLFEGYLTFAEDTAYSKPC